MDERTRKKRASLRNCEKEKIDPSRRDALKAVGKYTAFLAGSSTAVLLSADDVLAKPKPCSWFDNKPGNGPPPGRPPKRRC
jgi:hypothetical protein